MEKLSKIFEKNHLLAFICILSVLLLATLPYFY